MEPIERLVAALDELVAAGPEALAEASAIEVLERQLSRLEAVVCQSAAAYEASGDWMPSGARTATAWLATRTRLPKSAAARQLRLGRQAAERAVAGRAWEQGDIGTAQFATIGALRNERTEEALSRDEALLVDVAGRLRFADFARAAAYWAQLADPDGAEEAAEARRVARGLHLSQSLDGTWLGSLTLGPIAGTIVADELDRLEHLLFCDDWARAKESLGTDPGPNDLARTPAQRRADALVEMATRSKVAKESATRPAPLFSVLVDYDTLCGRVLELAAGTVLAPGELVPWLTEADLERAVFSAPTRVEVSATARLFTGATRRAIELRDRRCTHPYCDRPAAECEVDHIVPYAQGGPTTRERKTGETRGHRDRGHEGTDNAGTRENRRRRGSARTGRARGP
ncbi:MAG: HNH endonuclease signature motif containing protein, partial [Acidimicrobiales bacterium]